MGILFCLIILTVSLAGAAAGAGGIEISGSTVTGSLNGASYDAVSKTLTLNGGTWEYIKSDTDLTIILEGVNNITGGTEISDYRFSDKAKAGIYVLGNLIIKGGGTLNVDVTEERNYAYGVYSYMMLDDSSDNFFSSFSIEDSTVTVNVTSESGNVYGISSYIEMYVDSPDNFFSSFSIEDSTVTVNVTSESGDVYGIYSHFLSYSYFASSSSFSIEDSTVTVNADGYTAYGIYYCHDNELNSKYNNSGHITIKGSEVNVIADGNVRASGIWSSFSDSNSNSIIIEDSTVTVNSEARIVYGIYINSVSSGSSTSNSIRIDDSKVTVNSERGGDYGIYSYSENHLYSDSNSFITNSCIISIEGSRVTVTGYSYGIYTHVDSNSSTSTPSTIDSIYNYNPIIIEDSTVEVNADGDTAYGIYSYSKYVTQKGFNLISSSPISIDDSTVEVNAEGNTAYGIYSKSDFIKIPSSPGGSITRTSPVTISGAQTKLLAIGNTQAIYPEDGTFTVEDELRVRAATNTEGSGLELLSDESEAIDTAKGYKYVTIAQGGYVSYDLSGGESIGDDVSEEWYDAGNPVTLASAPTKEYHTFGGWGDGSKTYQVGDPFSMPNNNVTFIAQWMPYTYTVKFHNNTGSGSMAPQSFTYDVEQTLTANAFTKTGYKFNGWAKSANGAVVYADKANVKNLTTTKDGVVDLHANWTINQYTITFNTNGGTAVDSITQDYGTAVTAPANPTKNGYTFIGWDKAIPSTMPAENMVITAQWKANNSGGGSIIIGKNTHTLTFNANGGEGSMEEQNFISGEEKELSENKFQRAGHTFEGWAESADGNVVYTDCEKIKVTKSMTLYAVWKAETPVEPVVPEEPVLPVPIIGGVLAVLLAAGLIIFAVKKRR